MKYIERIEAQRKEHLTRHQSAVQRLEAEVSRCQRRLREIAQKIPTAIGDAAIAGEGYEAWRSLHDERMACSAFIADSEPVLAALRVRLDSRHFEQQIRVAGEQYRRMEELEKTIRSKMDSAQGSSVGTHHIVRYVARLRDVARRLEEDERCESFLRATGWQDHEAAA